MLKDFSADLPRLLEFIEGQADTRRKAGDLFNVQEAIDETAVNLFDAVKEMLQEKTGKKYSLDTDVLRKNRITARMSDSDRSRILKAKTIAPAEYLGQSEERIAKERENIDSAKIGLIKKALQRAGQEFGLPKTVTNNDTSMDVEIYISSFKESASKQIHNAEQLLKLMPLLDEAVGNAVGIERHANRYYADYNTIDFVNLLGGYIENDVFYPVRFGVTTKLNGPNSLYVVISDQGINKDEVVKPSAAEKTAIPGSHSSKVSIQLLAKKVNTPDILKYLPDGLLSAAQIEVKRKAIADTVEYTNNKNDKKYKEYLRKGDIQSIKRIVYAAATANMPDTKILDEDGKLLRVYHGTSENFTVFDPSKGRSTMDIQGSFFSPWEIDAGGYGENVGQYYLNITNPAPEGLAYKAMNMFKGQNNAGVKAREYLERLGYDGVNNGNEEYIAFYPWQIKSADAITYDDDGQIIPISKRFNDSNPDYRYSIDTDAIRDAFTIIDTEGIEDGLEALKGVTPGKGIWALKDNSRMLDAKIGDGGDKYVSVAFDIHARMRYT